jgi:TadE-like protein
MILHRPRISHDERGSTIVEFALVLVPLLTLITASWEMGRQVYVSSVVQGVVVQAARKSAMENATTSAVTTFVRAQLAEFAEPSAITLTMTNFRKFTGVNKAEVIDNDSTTTGTIGVLDIGECYIDSNNNNTRDMLQGDSGIGSADDAMRVSISVQAKRLTPIGEWIGFGETYNIERTTFVQIEPFAGIVEPPRRCRTV